MAKDLTTLLISKGIQELTQVKACNQFLMHSLKTEAIKIIAAYVINLHFNNDE